MIVTKHDIQLDGIRLYLRGKHRFGQDHGTKPGRLSPRSNKCRGVGHRGDRMLGKGLGGKAPGVASPVWSKLGWKNQGVSPRDADPSTSCSTELGPREHECLGKARVVKLWE
jgi:hypothetical protein